MFTIKVSRDDFGTTAVTGYFGTFDTTDAASAALAKVGAAGLVYPGASTDIIPVPDGVIPMPISADYL